MALKRAKVEASSALRRPENIYYPLLFRPLALHFPQMTHLPTLPALLKKPLPKILPSPAIHREKKSKLRSKKPSRMPPLMRRSSWTLPKMLPRMGEPLRALN